MKHALAAFAVLALAVPAWADINPGPDVIEGTSAGEVLYGGRSPDVIYGRGGDDTLWGQRGPDRLYGGKGNDRVNGYGSGNARDLLVGGPGKDRCTGTVHDTFKGCEIVRVRRGLGPR